MRSGAATAGRPVENCPERVYVSLKGSTKTEKQQFVALIIYPMNALVEDQLSRLRAALGFIPCARDWFDHNRDGNRFYYRAVQFRQLLFPVMS